MSRHVEIRGTGYSPLIRDGTCGESSASSRKGVRPGRDSAKKERALTKKKEEFGLLPDSSHSRGRMAIQPD